MATVLNQDVRDAQLWRAWVVDRRTQADIAAEHGLDQSAVSRALSRHRARLGENTIAEALQMDLVVLDMLQDANLAKAREGATSPEAAFWAVLGVLRHRAKVLGFTPPETDPTDGEPPERLEVVYARMMNGDGHE
jgi:ParB-like chromosome segregation protein Spo0J